MRKCTEVGGVVSASEVSKSRYSNGASPQPAGLDLPSLNACDVVKASKFSQHKV